MASSTCIIGTDNGFIIKRDGPNHFKVVYASSFDPTTNPNNSCAPCANQEAGAHGYRSLQCEDIQVGWDDPDIVVVHIEDEFSSFPWGGYVYSSDRGETFSEHSPLLKMAYGDPLGLEGINMDNDGGLWAYGDASFPNVPVGARGNWHRSYDGAASWTDLGWSGINGFNPQKTHWIGDGYVWATQVRPNLATTIDIWRETTLGAGLADYSIAKQAGATYSTLAALHGRPGTGRLVAWQPGLSQLTSSTTWPVLSVDISAPLTPILTWSANMPLCNNGEFVQMMLPITHDVVLANTLDAGATPYAKTGGIWRSADGGLTWTQVVANTTKLGLSTPAAGLGIGQLYEDNQRIASPPGDSDEVWAATKPPYVYHSSDAGLTWDIETVDMTIFNGYAGRLPSVWVAIGAVPETISQPTINTTPRAA